MIPFHRRAVLAACAALVGGGMATAAIHKEKKILIRLIPNQTATRDDLKITWDSLVIEETVNPDGTVGAPGVSLRLKLVFKKEAKDWAIFLPAAYQTLIENKSDSVSTQFGPYRLIIARANFTPGSGSWLELEVSQKGAPRPRSS